MPVDSDFHGVTPERPRQRCAGWVMYARVTPASRIRRPMVDLSAGRCQAAPYAQMSGARPLLCREGGSDSLAPETASPLKHNRGQHLVVASNRPSNVAFALAMGAVSLVLLRRGGISLSRARTVEILAATVGGLLSSSCCLIQLGLNSLSLGCAGFAMLDRYRPFFLAATASTLAVKTGYDVRRGMFRPLRSIAVWVFAAFLAGSPSVVRWANRRSLEARAKTRRLAYSITGLKCEACANGLRNALGSVEGVDACSVLFNEGLVIVNGPVDPWTVEQVIQTQGYKVTPLTVEAKQP